MMDLDHMYKAQSNLIDKITPIQKLPEYPFDIDLRDNQTLARNFIEWFFEELSEAMQELYNAYEFQVAHVDDKKHMQDAKESIMKFNEEIADCNHFLLELLIYCNIDENDLFQYFRRYNTDNHEPLNLDNLYLLDSIFKVCNFINQRNAWTSFENNRGGVTVSIMLGGGNGVGSLSRIKTCERLIFKCIHEFQLAKNCLKNKPWKQTEVPTDQELFQEHLIKGLEYYFRFLTFNNFTQENVTEYYMAKNIKNQERIKNKY